MGTWKIKQRRLKKEGPHCTYCDRIVTEDQIQIDHIIPRNRGGSGKVTNLVLACRKCNALKSDHSLKRFMRKANLEAARIYKEKAWVDGILGNEPEILEMRGSV